MQRILPAGLLLLGLQTVSLAQAGFGFIFITD
jgi:hypothetical protein